MSNLRTFFCLMATAVCLMATSCGDDPIADKIAGSYDCAVVINTRYNRSLDDPLRDTSYHYENNGKVTITKLDNNTATVRLYSNRMGIDHTFESVSLVDGGYVASFSSDAEVNIQSRPYETDFSASVTYDPRSIAASLRVKDHPNGKYIVSFTSHSY